MKGKRKRNSHVVIFVLETWRYTKWFLNLFPQSGQQNTLGLFSPRRKKCFSLLWRAMSDYRGIFFRVEIYVYPAEHSIPYREVWVLKECSRQSTLYIETHFFKRMEHSWHSVSVKLEMSHFFSFWGLSAGMSNRNEL